MKTGCREVKNQKIRERVIRIQKLLRRKFQNVLARRFWSKIKSNGIGEDKGRKKSKINAKRN